MKVIRESDLPLKEETVCTIGNFDGFHKGHAFILTTLKETARKENRKSLVITFEPHPKALLNPENAPCRITNLETKLDLLKHQGIDYVYVIHFDREFAQKTPQDFIQFLSQQLGCRKLIVGHDWRFGYKGEGNIETAKALGKQFDMDIIVIPPVKENNERISSTKIRQLLREGKVEQVEHLLGRTYCIKGTVQKGNQIGKEIGYPTINIKPSENLCLKKGVYSGFVSIDGKTYPAVINYGTRPTVDGKQLLIEAHIIGKRIGLEDSKQIKIFFKKFLREERKFDSLNQLKAQIKTDIEKTLQTLEV
ncbi:bifunctional riboflavin kinase/FAD synthetase [Persephonella atlantica]|uniref:Riboflavin biosynthesis protein n=1 Tax=Persephonella atlantica TaxID=2699429 RepID=A0ABS1GK29_9AQUI|nr:bifunctional riboflavin kinase/FAD synthetase [Persephonella atlantica]MBK3333251.1 bifunctional riboflavin kinase/FAD synthetase [Persephonella atlantica]